MTEVLSPSLSRMPESRSAQNAPAKKTAVRLACTTVYDPLDPAAFGGRIYHQLQALRSQLQTMHFIGPLSLIRPQAALVLAKREFYRHIQKNTAARLVAGLLNSPPVSVLGLGQDRVPARDGKFRPARLSFPKVGFSDRH